MHRFVLEGDQSIGNDLNDQEAPEDQQALQENVRKRLGLFYSMVVLCLERLGRLEEAIETAHKWIDCNPHRSNRKAKERLKELKCALLKRRWAVFVIQRATTEILFRPGLFDCLVVWWAWNMQD